MPRKLFLIFFLITFNILEAQTKFSQNYLGEDFLLYKGEYFKLMDNPTSGFRFSFYSTLDDCNDIYSNNVMYPDPKYRFITIKDSLKNKIFFVERIVNKSGMDWNEANYNEYLDKPIFLLKDTLNNQKIYFKYDSEYEHEFPFITSKINSNLDYYCSKIEKEKDDFTDELTFSSPLVSGKHFSPVIIYKIINKGKINYYLRLSTSGSTVNVNKRGVAILFKDGTKWVRDSKVEVEAGNKGFDYSAYIALTSNDLITFSTKRIEKFRLYIYDEVVSSGLSDKIIYYTLCIRKAK